MPIFSGDGRAKRHLNDDLFLAGKEGYWKCKRCEGWYPKEQFLAARPSDPTKIVEFDLCGACRLPMRGARRLTKEEHERRRAKRLGLEEDETNATGK